MTEKEPQKTVTFDYRFTDPKTDIRMVEIDEVNLETLKSVGEAKVFTQEEYLKRKGGPIKKGTAL